ncbi:MAG: endonuclease MutS2 [Myxococcaceae bacterium]
MNDLGFPEVLAALGKRCRTAPGAERALQRPFLQDVEQVRESLSRIDEARALAEQQFELPVGAIVDIRGALDRAEKHAMLEPRDLIQVGQVLFAFQRTREALEERESLVPAMAVIGRRLPLMPQLASRIDSSFGTNGELADHASPELREARDRTRGLHRRIKERLDSLLKDEKFTANLRETYYSIRHDRYVVPVLSQERGQVPGIVHNASQTGQTLFVEPDAIISLGNDLAIAESLVAEEERRILQELTDLVGAQVVRIREGVEAAAELDELEAAARLSSELRASTPDVEAGESALELQNLRHPLLLLRNKAVVPNDVRLGGSVKALVISGPNAGGKTVTLTAVGLSALMLRAGLPIPTDAGSKMPLYNSVHSSVGDAQDIHKDLSTFSAHLLELRRIAEAAGRGSLVLVDEIAADTDPREGAALAIAVLEDLITRGANILVTTHLEELKALAHMDERFLNARVGFDTVKMQPTYRLQLGVAGASSALEVAERMGLPAQVIQRARELAERAAGPLSKAIAATEAERARLAEELAKAQEHRRAAEFELRRLQEERTALERLRQDEEAKLHEQLAADAEMAAHELRELVTKMRAQPNLNELEKARKELAAQVAEHTRKAQEAKAQKEVAEAPMGMPQLTAGSWVRLPRLDRDVEVVELHGEEVVVAAGAMKMRVPVKELAPAKSNQRKAAKFPGAPSKREQLKKAEAFSGKPLSASGSRCDVRGLRGEDAVREVDAFLDAAMRRGEESATILHGHGTGALKQLLREHLDTSPYVRMFRPGEAGEGGDGVTVVSLRG